MQPYAIEMLGIHKSFGQNEVLHGVDFRLKSGSIHALLGENGTGKTTLMNVLGGVHPADAGEIRIDGQNVVMNGTKASEACGIAFIHQELTLINDLSVYENLFLGKELKKRGVLDKREMVGQSAQILKKIGIDISPAAMVRELNASYKQVVEIARALLRSAKTIIMDEPTASLTDVEIEHIFNIMRSLREQGVSFVFISHKLNEVMEIADSYTVMRNGEVVADGSVQDVDEKALARLMVGRELRYDDTYVSRNTGEVLLEGRNLSRERCYQNISFNVRQGEIVGFTGLLGDGRSELFETVFGCNRAQTGDILVHGKKVHFTSTSDAKRARIAYVPRNRKENGIIKDLSISENMAISVLERLKKRLVLSKTRILSLNKKYVEQLGIRVANLNDLITSLSGGNQQKAVLAKALGTEPELIILDNPTQGVDVGAKFGIYRIIMELAQQGVSFVILSSEAPEILTLCDRVYVMYHGEIRRELSRAQANEENIMILATGGSI